MTGRVKKQNHLTSIRMPDTWHEWVKQFADIHNVTPAHIYRSAVRQFIERNGQANR